PLMCGVAPIGATVWYRVTVGASGRLTATTHGSQFDTTLAVYRGTALGALTMVGCNDDADGRVASQLAVALAPNETYYLQL
ncbi:MAG: hypothetical protein NZ518_10695, partial [Dehalococcoidia bacterium]|nr:hypothetical protein [Dehalococcoidia bacterium]